jgi:hypothetical protein
MGKQPAGYLGQGPLSDTTPENEKKGSQIALINAVKYSVKIPACRQAGVKSVRTKNLQQKESTNLKI